MNIVRYDDGWINLDNGLVFYERPQGGIAVSSLVCPTDQAITVWHDNVALLEILKAATIHTANKYG